MITKPFPKTNSTSSRTLIIPPQFQKSDSIIYHKKIYTHEVGLSSELKIVEILNEFDNIEKIWKDCSNSKFDIYYILKGETVIRGLQVKTLTPRTNNIPSSAFGSRNMNRYDDGMLIVCFNYEHLAGLAYINSDKYKNSGSIDVSFVKNPTNNFSKILLRWDEFLIHLKNILFQGMIITDKIFESKMSKNCFMEHKSIERFFIFCEKYGWTCVRNIDNNSVTDLFINGYKAQMKYCSKPLDPNNGCYAYSIPLSKKSPLYKRKGSYEKGDNDFYIIEIGSNHGDFLILSEQVLIDKGLISINGEETTQTLNVYPYDYVENKLLTTPNRYKYLVKGNWTCDKKYWYSTEEGPLFKKNEK